LALALGLTLFLAGLGPPLSGLRPGATLLSDVRLVDLATGSVREHQDLLWEQGRLAGIGPRGSLAQRGARVLTGRGAWVLPAPADAAVFLSLEGRLPGDSVPAAAATSLALQSRAGMGLLLDLNADRTFMAEARAVTGVPQARFAGALFTAPGGWRLSGQTPWNSHVAELAELADLDAPWARLIRFGDQAVFASVEHEGRDDLSIPLPVLKELGRRAHGLGLPFIIHAQHHAKALAALAARPDALLGPLLDDGDDAALGRAMAAAGCLYLPALGTVLNALPGEPLADWMARFPASAWVDPSVLGGATDPQRAEGWVRHFTRQGVDPARVLAVPGRLAAAGASLGFATGSGQPLVFHGPGAQAELALMQRAGLSPIQILQALAQSRRLLGAAGHLSVGDDATLLLLKGSPLDDPKALFGPRGLFIRGEELP
jgi:imidazolonepropionase-like amidohydrolase